MALRRQSVELRGQLHLPFDRKVRCSSPAGRLDTQLTDQHVEILGPASHLESAFLGARLPVVCR